MCAALVEFPGYEKVEAPKPWQSKFAALFLDQLDAPGPEFEWLVSGWLSIGDKSIIGGPSQSGKSFLAIHAGMCVALGTEFFGAEVERGLVIYIAGEGARGVKKRLRAWRKQFGVEFDRKTPFVLLQTPVNLYAQDGDTGPLIAEVRGICEQFPGVPLRLVVIDTLATASIGADENAARDMSIVMSNVGKINEATRAAVCLVHHMNAGGEKLRGSTAIYAALDTTIYVTRNKETNVRTVSLGKERDEDDKQSFQFELMRVVLGEDKRGKEITSCVCLPVGEKEAIRRDEERKGWRLSSGEEVFMRALFDADKRSGAPVPADLDLPARVRSIVAYDDVKRVYASSIPSDVIAPDLGEAETAVALNRHREALKKKLQRVRESLTGSGVIGFRDGMVWWTGKPLRAFPWTSPREEVPAPSLQTEEIPF